MRRFPRTNWSTEYCVYRFDEGSIENPKIEWGSKLIIDKSLLDDLLKKVKFVEEGKLFEKEGFPTLNLICGSSGFDNAIIP